MRICHYTLGNGSGLNRVAVNMQKAECVLGLDSLLYYTDDPTKGVDLDIAKSADVHVVHSHLPDSIKGKSVFVAHGTPEHCFGTALTQGKANYQAGDSFMMSLYRMNHAEVTVTFWERHAALWQSLCPKADVMIVPMGVDKTFWIPMESKGKWAGTPSLFSCENSHQIKWPLDLILAYPMLMSEFPDIVLHLHYLPLDEHRWWYQLLSANGTLYKSFSSAGYFAPEDLKNGFASVDYYMNLVKYGDFNQVCLEAKATGCKVISYTGNEYSDYWISEGDQRIMAKELTAILKGEIEPRTALEVPSIEDMAQAMKVVYESIH